MKSRLKEFQPNIPCDILEFCLRHKERQDTVEGIAEWWLMEHRIDRTLPEVKAALESLVQDRMMIETKAADGRTYYRLNPEKEVEAREYTAGE